MEGGNQNVCNVCGSGNGRCGQCGNMCGFGKNHVLRWILGIIIITWVFSIGVKFGELNAQLDQVYSNSGYGFHSMPMMYRTGSAGQVWGSGAENVTFTTQATPATMMTGVKGGAVQIIKGN